MANQRFQRENGCLFTADFCNTHCNEISQFCLLKAMPETQKMKTITLNTEAYSLGNNDNNNIENVNSI